MALGNQRNRDLQFKNRRPIPEALILNVLFLRKSCRRLIILHVIDWQIYFWIRCPITPTPQQATRYGQDYLY